MKGSGRVETDAPRLLGTLGQVPPPPPLEGTDVVGDGAAAVEDEEVGALVVIRVVVG